VGTRPLQRARKETIVRSGASFVSFSPQNAGGSPENQVLIFATFYQDKVGRKRLDI